MTDPPDSPKDFPADHYTTVPAAPDELVSRLREHTMLADLPEDEIAWIARHGTLRRFAAGALMSSPRFGRIEEMTIVLTGRMTQYAERGGGRRRAMEWCGGQITGLLPFSRLTLPPGDGVVDEDAEIVAVHERDFPEMIRECPQLLSKVVRIMLDRARHFTQADLHDDKMASLGRLAAGLAHELDNPASAVIRTAKLLDPLLRQAEEASRELGRSGVSGDELARIERIREGCVGTPLQQVRSPLDQAKHEEEMLEWLDDRGIELENEDTLTDSAISVAALESIAGAVDPVRLEAAVRWVVASCSVLAVGEELSQGASRISELVKAVKGFTRLDAGVSPEPVSVEQGLTQTLTVLRAKARQKSVNVTIEVEPELPTVVATAGELNQIWSNLIDNALDAVGEGGSIEVRAEAKEDEVVVRIIDDGPGIPEAGRTRIFEPFFTTKPVGQGTGLGLDIVNRLVTRNGGAIEFDSAPGRTEFRVWLPINEGGPKGAAG